MDPASRPVGDPLALDPALLSSAVVAACAAARTENGALQALDAALAAGDPAGVGPALLAADAALTARGLRVALADAYGAPLATLDPASLSPEARSAAAELLLLSGAPDAARHMANPGDAGFAALLAIAGAGPVPEATADPLASAALAGLTAEAPADDRERGLAAMLAEGRQGRALLSALDLVQSGERTDPPALRAAMLTLKLAGQGEAARTIALETILASGS